MKSRMLILVGILVVSLVFVGCELGSEDVYNYDSTDPGMKGVPATVLLTGGLGGAGEEPPTGAPGEEPPTGGDMSAEEIQIITEISVALDKKIIAGEITQEMKLDTISKVHSNEIDLMQLMTELNISIQ